MCAYMSSGACDYLDNMFTTHWYAPYTPTVGPGKTFELAANSKYSQFPPPEYMSCP